MKVPIDLVSQTSCKKTYNSRKIGVSTICAGGSGDSGVCTGDTGGPLLLMKASAQADVQVGITSTRSMFTCPKVADRPDIFTRVSSYAKWIDEQICLYSKRRPSTCPTLVPKRHLRAADPSIESTAEMP